MVEVHGYLFDSWPLLAVAAISPQEAMADTTAAPVAILSRKVDCATIRDPAAASTSGALLRGGSVLTSCLIEGLCMDLLSLGRAHLWFGDRCARLDLADPRYNRVSG
jgi:hypothetical protein